MKIHILGTVNGQENEGMRNVATHLARCFEKEHDVSYSGLKQVGAILRNSMKSDVTMIFARANKMVYWLSRIVEVLCKNLWFVCVQKPNKDFHQLNKNRPLSCNYLTISKEDVAQIVCASGFQKYCFDVGINVCKFSPVDSMRQRELKIKYGLNPDKLLAVHVGHCSAGRGLEDFAMLDGEMFERFVIASGMFESEETVRFLEKEGVRIHRGYLENVEEIYQMADVYLFPTKSNEYVISIPLSVMEALACGTPVIGYGSFKNLRDIASEEGSIAYISSSTELNKVASEHVRQKRQISFLRNPVTWEKTAQNVLHVMEDKLK